MTKWWRLLGALPAVAAACGAAEAQSYVSVSGSGTFGSTVASTLLSAPDETWSFSFTTATPLGGSAINGMGWDVVSSYVSDVSLELNGVAVSADFTDALFYVPADGGALDVNFYNGAVPNTDNGSYAYTLSLYSPTNVDFGSDGTPVLGTYAVNPDVDDDNFPAGSGGSGTVTIAAAPPPPVPEPASWTLMIGGSAAAGGALRRRRATIPA
jgi:hypothetical protein